MSGASRLIAMADTFPAPGLARSGHWKFRLYKSFTSHVELFIGDNGSTVRSSRAPFRIYHVPVSQSCPISRAAKFRPLRLW
jgi:hypothetical protein